MNPTECWRQLRVLGLIKSKTDRKPLPFSVDELNDYFSSITANGDPVSNIDSTLHSTPDPELRRFYFSHLTLDIFLNAFY